jgi:hypothetical protein
MVRMPAGHLPSPPMEAARLFPEPAAGEPYTILIMHHLMQIFVCEIVWAFITAGPCQCALFLIPRSFHDGGALNYSTAPHRSKTTLISNGVFCLLESKILSIGQTLLYSLVLQHYLKLFQIKLVVWCFFSRFKTTFVTFLNFMGYLGLCWASKLTGTRSS